MSEDDGLIWAYRVDSNGHGQEIGWDELDVSSEGTFRWIHLELEADNARTWLRERSGIGTLEADALLAEETRPRVTPIGSGLVLNLRGVNLNPGADPEDMVALRLWADGERVITVRRRRLLALDDLRTQIAAGRGAKSPGEFVADIADRLVDRMSSVLSGLDDGLDDLEALDEDTSAAKRGRLVELRREAITLRRYISPQRDALARLTSERVSWIGERERQQLREVLDRTTRYVEDLEAARERAAVCQEELASLLAEQLNRRMYALGIVAGIFLPLSFVTGLLGINVAGMPGAEVSWAFAAVCGALLVLGIGELLLFRRRGWL